MIIIYYSINYIFETIYYEEVAMSKSVSAYIIENNKLKLLKTIKLDMVDTCQLEVKKWLYKNSYKHKILKFQEL